MIPRKTPLKRSTKPIARNKPVNKFRSKPRRGKVSPAQRKKIRLAVYERSGGRCELNLRKDCIKGVLPFTGSTPWDHWHLVHIKSEGSGGKTDMENCKGGCWKCHLLGLHRGETSESKPVPSKNKNDWTEGYENY